MGKVGEQRDKELYGARNEDVDVIGDALVGVVGALFEGDAVVGAFAKPVAQKLLGKVVTPFDNQQLAQPCAGNAGEDKDADIH